MTPEGKNVEYIKRRIHSIGGEVRKCNWSGVRGAPDLFILLPNFHAFCEVKAPGKAPQPHQLREIDRLINAGCRVFIVSNRADVDWMIEVLQQFVRAERDTHDE